MRVILRAIVNALATRGGPMCVDQERLHDAHLALRLLDDAFLEDGPELYDAQGFNQAHRVTYRGHVTAGRLVGLVEKTLSTGTTAVSSASHYMAADVGYSD